MYIYHSLQRNYGNDKGSNTLDYLSRLRSSIFNSRNGIAQASLALHILLNEIVPYIEKKK